MNVSTKSNSKPKLPPLKIKEATLRFKNFAGVAKRFNALGDRNFHVVIDLDTARSLEDDGWNIKYHEPRNENEERWASLKVAVRFDKFPPRIIMKAGGNRTLLDGESVGILDWATLSGINMMITASYYENTNGKGFKAYLSRMVVSVDEDDLEFEGLNSAPVSDEIDDN